MLTFMTCLTGRDLGFSFKTTKRFLENGGSATLEGRTVVRQLGEEKVYGRAQALRTRKAMRWVNRFNNRKVEEV